MQGEQALLPKELKLEFDFGKVVEAKGEGSADISQSNPAWVSCSPQPVVVTEFSALKGLYPPWSIAYLVCYAWLSQIAGSY